MDRRPARSSERSTVAKRRTRRGQTQHAAEVADSARTPSSTSPHTRSVRAELTEGEAGLNRVSDQAENVMAQLWKALPSELHQEDPYLLSDLDLDADLDLEDDMPREKPLGRRSTGEARYNESTDLLDWRTFAAAASKDIDVDVDAAKPVGARFVHAQWYR